MKEKLEDDDSVEKLRMVSAQQEALRADGKEIEAGFLVMMHALFPDFGDEDYHAMRLVYMSGASMVMALQSRLTIGVNPATMSPAEMAKRIAKMKLWQSEIAAFGKECGAMMDAKFAGHA